MDLKETKKQLRKQLREQANGLDKEYVAASDAAIERQLLAMEQWQQAETVFAYVSRGAEPYTHRLINTALQAGKRVAVPLCRPKGIMDAKYIASLDELAPNRMGILEPEESTETADPAGIELVVVPCVATDKRLYRLGYGGGYYDRYLLRTSCPMVCLCRGKMVVDELPVESFDLVMECVLTEDGIKRQL